MGKLLRVTTGKAECCRPTFMHYSRRPTDIGTENRHDRRCSPDHHRHRRRFCVKPSFWALFRELHLLRNFASGSQHRNTGTHSDNSPSPPEPGFHSCLFRYGERRIPFVSPRCSQGDVASHMTLLQRSSSAPACRSFPNILPLCKRYIVFERKREATPRCEFPLEKSE